MPIIAPRSTLSCVPAAPSVSSHHAASTPSKPTQKAPAVIDTVIRENRPAVPVAAKVATPQPAVATQRARATPTVDRSVYITTKDGDLRLNLVQTLAQSKAHFAITNIRMHDDATHLSLWTNQHGRRVFDISMNPAVDVTDTFSAKWTQKS